MKEVQVDGESLCIVNVEGKYYAIVNICTHGGGPPAMVLLKAMTLNVHNMLPNLM